LEGERLNQWNLKDLGFLAIRVLAIYAFILGIQRLVILFENALPFYISMLDPEEYNIYGIALVAGVPALLLIIISILLWFFAGKLSGKIVPPQAAETESPGNAMAWESFILSVVGFVISILSLSRMSFIILNYIQMERITPEYVYFDRLEYLSGLVEQLILLILGLLLILKADGLAYLLRKIRSLGFRHAETADRDGE
jgi:hypothetical protein